MTDEIEIAPAVYTYQIFQITGMSFVVNSPRTLGDFMLQVVGTGYVMTQTDFAPYHGIVHIRSVPAQGVASAVDLRSMN